MDIKSAGDLTLIPLSVNMSNALSRAAHNLTINEKRIIAMCISKTDSIRFSSYERMKQTIRIHDFSNMFGVNEKNAFRDMIQASDNLLNRQVRLLVETPKGLKESKFNWVSGAVYHHGEGWIEISFTHEVTPHLTMLRKEYTTYKLKAAAPLRSVYSWRLYELLSSVSKKNNFSGKLLITLSEFRHAMEITDGYKFNDIKRRVIEKSCSEIEQCCNVQITFKVQKKGRSVSSLQFFFSEIKQQQLDLS